MPIWMMAILRGRSRRSSAPSAAAGPGGISSYRHEGDVVDGPRPRPAATRALPSGAAAAAAAKAADATKRAAGATAEAAKGAATATVDAVKVGGRDAVEGTKRMAAGVKAEVMATVEPCTTRKKDGEGVSGDGDAGLRQRTKKE